MPLLTSRLYFLNCGALTSQVLGRNLCDAGCLNSKLHSSVQLQAVVTKLFAMTWVRV